MHLPVDNKGVTFLSLIRLRSRDISLLQDRCLTKYQHRHGSKSFFWPRVRVSAEACAAFASATRSYRPAVRLTGIEPSPRAKPTRQPPARYRSARVRPRAPRYHTRPQVSPDQGRNGRSAPIPKSLAIDCRPESGHSLLFFSMAYLSPTFAAEGDELRGQDTRTIDPMIARRQLRLAAPAANCSRPACHSFELMGSNAALPN